MFGFVEFIACFLIVLSVKKMQSATIVSLSIFDISFFIGFGYDFGAADNLQNSSSSFALFDSLWCLFLLHDTLFHYPVFDKLCAHSSVRMN